MEAFTVQCTTCQSKLRVRDPNLIHQIVSCPKCNSMIQIEPPGQISVQPPGQYNVDSTAVTREVHYPPEPPPLGIARSHGQKDDDPSDHLSGAGNEQPTLDNVDWSEDEFRLAPLEDEPSVSAEAPTSWLPSESPWQPSDAPPLTPSDEWTSPQAAQSKQYLLIGFVGLGGILAAALLFFFFLRWINDSPSEQLANANQPFVAGDENASPSAEEKQADADDAEPDSGSDPQLIDAAEPATDSPMEPASDEDGGTESDPTTLVDSQGDGDDVDATTTETEPAVTTVADVADVGAGGGGDNNLLDLSGSGDSDAVAAGGSSLPKQLQDFQQMLSYQVVPTLQDTLVLPTEAPLTAEELGFDVASTSAASPTLNLAELSKAEMPAMVFRDRSLSSIVNLWTHLSGIPTVVDLQALAAAGIDPGSPVNLKLTAQAALPLGRSIATAVGCKLVEQDTTHLLITPPASKIQEHLPASLKLGDLIADDAARGWLDQAIAELLPDLVGMTQWQGSELQFVANDQTQQSGWIAWYRLVNLLDNWHQAAKGSGLAELKMPMPRQPLLDPFNLAALDKKMDFVVAESLPSGQLLTRCADQAGLQCWIDWASVGEGGLHPGSRFASVTYHREFRRILADYAAEYSLVVALLDERSLWLASAPRYRSETRLYAIPSEGRTVEQWQQQLRPLTPIAADGSSLLRIIPTPDEQWVLVRCCPPAVR